MKRAVERGLQPRSLDEVRYVGIDEKSFSAGEDYVSVMTDIDQSRVLEVTPDRTTDAADALWNTLSEEQRSKVKAVCMDIWQAYEMSTERNIPNARILHDRFHIAKYLNEAVDKVRRAEHRELQEDSDDRLPGVRQILLFNPVNLSDEKNEELAALRKSTLATGRAWSLKELFRFFWQEGDAVGGEHSLIRYAWAIRCRLEPIRKVARMLSPISNGPAEGFNSRIQSIKSAVRGFRIFEHYRIRMLFYCGKRSLTPRED
jgi:transposase